MTEALIKRPTAEQWRNTVWEVKAGLAPLPTRHTERNRETYYYNPRKGQLGKILCDYWVATRFYNQGYYGEQEFQSIRTGIVDALKVYRNYRNAHYILFELAVASARRNYQFRTGEFNYDV